MARRPLNSDVNSTGPSSSLILQYSWLPLTLINILTYSSAHPSVYCTPCSVITKCLLVNTALAPGTTTIVCVSSITTAGPSTASPTASFPSSKTGVSSIRPTLSKYTECRVAALLAPTARTRSWSSASKTDSPDSSVVVPIPRTLISSTTTLASSNRNPNSALYARRKAPT